VTIGIDPSGNHTELGLEDQSVLEMYRLMVLARRLDDRVWALNRQGRVPFVVSSSGHEAAQIGAAFALDRTTDWVLPYYRDTALVLALGMSPEEVFLGVFAKASDPSSGGRQMPSHWSLPRVRMLSSSSPIGVQFTQAVGIALELRRTGRPGVVLVDGGEGASSQGDLHEAMNFAALHRLPVLFYIQNNQYAISVPASRQIAGSLVDRARGYGMAAESMDGNDVLDVYRVVKAARDRAAAGEGPTFVEALTYRYYAHTSDDDDKLYRSAEEVEAWRQRDPVALLRQYLVESRLLSEASEEDVEEWATAEVADAVRIAEEAPDADDAFGGVYARPIENTLPAVSAGAAPQGEEVNLVTAINRALHEVMEADDRTVLFGEDVADPKGGVFKTTVGLTDRFGEPRAFNTPLAESLIAGLAVGMAAAGGRPLAEIQFADFIHPAFNQIVSEAARMHYRSNGGWTCSLVLRAPYGGGIHGALYHSQSIEAFYAHVPGLKVVIPSTPADAKGLLRSAVEDPDPVLFLEPKKLYRLARGPYPDGDYRVPIGTAALRREGRDLTIVAYGTMAHFAVEAAQRLADQGIDAAVLDLRSIRPLDWVSIEAAVQTTSKILIVHEDSKFGGFGAEVSAQIMERAFDWLDAPVERYCGPEVPAFPYAPDLEEQVMPSVDGIVARAAELAAY
jgi:2-oxoisovalerate dehydrogenase E1 component